MHFKKNRIMTSCTTALFAFILTTPSFAADGKAVYTKTCQVCHSAGIMGAPKFGSKKDWAPRIKKGMEVLNQHAIKGFKGKLGAMPPKGGNASLSDEDVKAAVDYMVKAAK